jgi:hypothetical protein
MALLVAPPLSHQTKQKHYENKHTKDEEHQGDLDFFYSTGWYFLH